MISYTNLEGLDQEEICRQIEDTREFTCVLPYSSPRSEQYLSGTLSAILVCIEKTELFTYLEYCLKEIVMNASKANSKRVYFREKGLRITDPEDYRKGMVTFKQEVFGNFDEYAPRHEALKSAIKIQLKVTSSSLVISVLNNSTIHPEEKQRIADRLKIADKFTSMNEVLTYGFDETEGAGFGLIIVILMLRKMNLDERVLVVKEQPKFTLTTLTVPLQLLSAEQGRVLAQEISEEIDKMPQFPEGVVRLQQELGNPNSDFLSLAAIIKQDSALTTEILRVANSALYRLPEPIDEIEKAVKMIGVQGLNNMVINFGVNKVFEQRYPREKIAEVMNHSREVAAICSQLLQVKKLAALKEDIYVAALLHDFGKIIVNSLQPELAQKLKLLCAKKHIPINALEDLSDGYNHSLIGAMLARKWNFPEKLTQCIQFHHIPLEANEEHQAVIYLVYLANELYYIYRGERRFEELNFKVLKYLGLEQAERFKAVAEQIQAATREN